MIFLGTLIMIPVVGGYAVYDIHKYEKKIDKTILNTVHLVMPIIEDSCWTFNYDMLSKTFKKLIDTGFIGYVHLEDELGAYDIVLGNKIEKNQIIEIFYVDQKIATLYVGQNKKYKEKYIKEKVREVLFNEIARNITFGMIGYIILNYLLIKHLKSISKQLNNKNTQIYLDRIKKNDELCDIVRAINQFIENEKKSKENLILQVGRIVCILDDVKLMSTRTEEAVVAVKHSLEMLIYVYDKFANNEKPEFSANVTVGDISRAGKDIKEKKNG